MTIENCMVELYHAHTDEDTKLSRHIYSNTLWITTFSTTNVARDGRSGIAICYGYARGVSISCDKCRKERKYHCKCNDREYLRSAVTVEKEHCQRIHCLKHFLLEGMPSYNIHYYM